MKKLIVICGLTVISYTTKAQKLKPKVEGSATFYADKFQGKRTATGEIFSQKKLTAASNRFKLGTWVKVINMETLQEVVVKITDRMHPRMARMGRVVDLSKAAAKLINLRDGVLKVIVQPIDYTEYVSVE